MNTKTVRCVACRAEFSDEEVKGASCCPACADTGVPCAISQDTTIKINWHALRILTIWASNYATKIEPRAQRSLQSIIDQLELQRPEGAAPLTWPTILLVG